MRIRKARDTDLDAVTEIYDNIHTAEEAGKLTIGWIRDVYPTRETALEALGRDDLFVLEDEGRVLGAAVINKRQVDAYLGAAWEHEAADNEICVLHTLVVDPAASGRGYGTAFVRFYEDYAAAQGCCELRIDTNARNTEARALYHKLGYTEIGIVLTNFNRIPEVQLVLLEKRLRVKGDCDGHTEGR